MTTPANTQGAGSEPRCGVCGLTEKHPVHYALLWEPDYHDFVPPVSEQADEPSGDGLCNARVCSSTGSRVCHCYLACGRRCGLPDSHPVHQIGNAHGHAFVQMGDPVTPSPRLDNVDEKEEPNTMGAWDCGVCGEEYVGKLWNCPTCKARSEQVGSGEFEKLLDTVLDAQRDLDEWEELAEDDGDDELAADLRDAEATLQSARAAVLSYVQRVERERDEAVSCGNFQEGQIESLRGLLYSSNRTVTDKTFRIAELEARVESPRGDVNCMARFITKDDEFVNSGNGKCECDRRGFCIYCIARDALASTSGSGNGDTPEWLKEMSVITLGPNDVLALMLDEPLSLAQVEKLKQSITSYGIFPPGRVLILSGGIRPGVIKIESNG